MNSTEQNSMTKKKGGRIKIKITIHKSMEWDRVATRIQNCKMRDQRSQVRIVQNDWNMSDGETQSDGERQKNKKNKLGNRQISKDNDKREKSKKTQKKQARNEQGTLMEKGDKIQIELARGKYGKYEREKAENEWGRSRNKTDQYEQRKQSERVKQVTKSNKKKQKQSHPPFHRPIPWYRTSSWEARWYKIFGLLRFWKAHTGRVQ